MGAILEIYLKYFGSTKGKSPLIRRWQKKKRKNLQNVADIELSAERCKLVCKIRGGKVFQAIHGGLKCLARSHSCIFLSPKNELLLEKTAILSARF